MLDIKSRRESVLLERKRAMEDYDDRFGKGGSLVKGQASASSIHQACHVLDSRLSSLSYLVSSFNSSMSGHLTTLTSLEADLSLVEDCLDCRASSQRLQSLEREARDLWASGDLRSCSRACVSFQKTLDSAKDRDKVLSMLGSKVLPSLASTRESLTDSLMKKYTTAATERSQESLAQISAVLPLLGDLGMASQTAKLYLSYFKSTLDSAINSSDVVGDDDSSGDAYDTVAGIFNSGATLLRHHLPMVSSSLGGAGGDVSLIQLLHITVEDRALEAIEDLESKDVKALRDCSKSVAAMEDELMSSSMSQHSSAPPPPPSSPSLSSLDDLCDKIARLIQCISLYETFVRHCAAEVQKASGGGGGGEAIPKQPEIIPKVTKLGEKAVELAAVLAAGENLILLKTIAQANNKENVSYECYEDDGKQVRIII